MVYLLTSFTSLCLQNVVFWHLGDMYVKQLFLKIQGFFFTPQQINVCLKYCKRYYSHMKKNVTFSISETSDSRTEMHHKNQRRVFWM